MSLIWEELARRVDDAHVDVKVERDRKTLESFDDAWAARPVRVDNGPVLIAWLIPLAIGALLGWIGHMVWMAVRG